MYFLFSIWEFEDTSKKQKNCARLWILKQHENWILVVFNFFFLLEHTSGDDNDPRFKGKMWFFEDLKRKWAGEGGREREREKEREKRQRERQRERERASGGARKKETEKDSKEPERDTKRQNVKRPGSEKKNSHGVCVWLKLSSIWSF